MPRTEAPRVFRSNLCPIDISNNSRAALRYAVMLARLSDAHLLVLYVTDPLLATVAGSRPDVRAMLASTEDDLRRFISSVMRRSTPPVATTLLTIAGKPAVEIVKAAERHHCDVIVMGYRGAGRATRLLFGSTTEGVVRRSRIPVVAVPPARRPARLPAIGRTMKRAS
jgi:nucleotide-binding universal stress UspA family protein